MAALRAGKRLGVPVMYEIRAFWEDAAVGNGTNEPRMPWAWADYPAPLPHVLGGQPSPDDISEIGRDMIQRLNLDQGFVRRGEQ